MQIGTPEEIYKMPQNAFVAGFIGTSNFLDGEVVSQRKDLTASIKLKSGDLFEIMLKKQYTGRVTVSIRPEEFRIMKNPDVSMEGRIIISTFLGDFVNYEVQLKDGSMVEVNEYTKDIDIIRNIGQGILLSLIPGKISIFDSTGSEAVV
jgi:iron(III) transport system ATP-binding protein